MFGTGEEKSFGMSCRWRYGSRLELALTEFFISTIFGGRESLEIWNRGNGTLSGFALPGPMSQSIVEKGNIKKHLRNRGHTFANCHCEPFQVSFKYSYHQLPPQSYTSQSISKKSFRGSTVKKSNWNHPIP